MLAGEGLDRILLKLLGRPMTEARMQAWQELVHRIKNPVDELTIYVVGKYTTRGTSRCSSTRNLSRGRSRRTRCLRASSRPAIGTRPGNWRARRPYHEARGSD